MWAEFSRTGTPDQVIGVASWGGAEVSVKAEEDDARASIERIFRLLPVVIDDRASRPPGASGPTVFQPGDLAWFRAAVESRGGAEGLQARIVTEHPGGWDPAGAPLTYGWSGLMVARDRRDV